MVGGRIQSTCSWVAPPSLLRKRSYTQGQSLPVLPVSDVILIDGKVAHQLGLERESLPQLASARALHGHVLGTISYWTSPVWLLISGNNHETIQFHILESLNPQLILGYPWLRIYNPHIDWCNGAIYEWSSSCNQSCLQQTSSNVCPPNFSLLPDQSMVPNEYQGLCQVFSKARATSLPPHLPYDCTIDLLSGSPGGPCTFCRNLVEGHRCLYKRFTCCKSNLSFFLPCRGWVFLHLQE